MTASLIPGVLVALVLARGRFWGKALLDGVVRLSLDRCGTRLRGDGLSADGARDPPVDRGGRPPAGGCGCKSRRRAGVGLFGDHLPLALPGAIAGMILSFARSMGEFGATITFVSNIPGETQTLPSAIYTLTQIPGGDAGALRLTLISIAISMLALLVSEAIGRVVGRRIGVEA